MNYGMGAKIAKTADRKKVMDTARARIVLNAAINAHREAHEGTRAWRPGGIYISCSACEFFEKL